MTPYWLVNLTLVLLSGYLGLALFNTVMSYFYSYQKAKLVEKLLSSETLSAEETRSWN